MSYCARCNNTGTIDCHCGGDLCVCENYGEKTCPACDGFPDADHDDHPDDYEIDLGEPGVTSEYAVRDGHADALAELAALLHDTLSALSNKGEEQ